jgi:lipopolysaccharide biosynthesis glycosyltransferase
VQAIVTICDKHYKALLPFWAKRIRSVTSMPVVVLSLAGAEISASPDYEVISINQLGNPFPAELPHHACAEKLRIFHHLPEKLNEVLFVDVDVLVFNDFWTKANYFQIAQSALVAAPDLFIGYKEKMEEEFEVFDPNFRMKFFPDGRYFYFNTGVFFASRSIHADIFRATLKTWSEYVGCIGRYPSIFDQNILNYCLIKLGVDVVPMPVQNNCLRQYDSVWIDGCLRLDGERVNVYHFNGGDAAIKLRRWHEFNQRYGGRDEYAST